ncbi:Cof-type HAD-IIB family hydrolase [Bacillus carboniphilus]|uniref:Cof-type HAD-IIB family hydrolase n=1 Tax=Bacillus carboniphilus TaxID=86663 RepID=A0ABY9JWY5_9BACI|nr:Cof-type HAD-IIB family hydrolase [Bacillus carboniphilus]WLR43018.1 Cof-type HAD-IIB family hydrolase [Bacillus carboniphilus]
MKLIAIDLDGTLLSSRMTISKQNIEAIKLLQRKGHIVMICSGRAPEDIKEIVEKYDLDCPIAGSNGSVVYVNQKCIHSTSMNLVSLEKTYNLLEELNFPFKIYTNDGIYIPKTWQKRVLKLISIDENVLDQFSDEQIKLMTEQPKESVIEKEIDSRTDLSRLTVQKFFILTFHEQTKKHLIQQLDSVEKIAITTSGPFNVEVMDINGNKYRGLKAVAEYYNIPLENTVAIGDNFNDLPMLEKAGTSIAMANGDPEIKKRCHYHTLTNDKDGVAFAIEKFILT